MRSLADLIGVRNGVEVFWILTVPTLIIVTGITIATIWVNHNNTVLKMGEMGCSQNIVEAYSGSTRKSKALWVCNNKL